MRMKSVSEQKAGKRQIDDKPDDITSYDVNYIKDINGFYAHPMKDGTYPGIILIHEWWGLNDTIKKTAETLAVYGYNVLAVDLFHGVIAKDPNEAMKQVTSVDQREAIQNMNAAFQYLKKHNSSKIASWGWCFGGGQSMQLALNTKNLSATVIYYGNLETNTSKLSSITWPILGIFGDKDATIPVAKVDEFRDSINSLKIQNEIYIYPGVGHAFANPTGPNHAPKETADAWDKTIIFLNKILK
jgi:carboxymethylenebutenolidase